MQKSFTACFFQPLFVLRTDVIFTIFEAHCPIKFIAGGIEIKKAEIITAGNDLPGRDFRLF